MNNTFITLQISKSLLKSNPLNFSDTAYKQHLVNRDIYE